MDLAYPPPAASIFLPRSFEGQAQPAIFVIMHQNPDTKVFWHLNDNWLGTTSGPEHRMPVFVEAGDYVVTAVDESGQSISRKVRFLNPLTRQRVNNVMP